jgi:hypothetical protein
VEVDQVTDTWTLKDELDFLEHLGTHSQKFQNHLPTVFQHVDLYQGYRRGLKLRIVQEERRLEKERLFFGHQENINRVEGAVVRNMQELQEGKSLRIRRRYCREGFPSLEEE